MHIVFFSTSDVFEAEEKIKEEGIECNVVPTPVTDKAYCGVCICTDDSAAKKAIEGMEFNLIE